MPKYSICIPTRERDATLRSSIETVLAQTHDDFELIVQDNASSPATRAVVDSFNDPRIRYFRSEERLAMHDNWEQALSRTTGDYILFIGDDDAVMPDCLERADPLLRAMDTDILAWPSHLYYWPDCPDPDHRNLLIADVRNGRLWTDGYADDPFGSNISGRYPHRPPGTLVFDSRKIAKAWYSWKGVRLYVPLYHNFVHRRVIDRVRNQFGRYFLDPTPDFASLAVNTYFSKTILFYSRALSMSGHSGRSNGGSHGSSEALEKVWETLLGEAGISVADITPEGIPSIKWIPCLLYGCMEHVRRKAFPDDTQIPNNEKDFVHYAATSVESEPPETREICRQWVFDMATRCGLRHSEIAFPPAAPQVRQHSMMNDSEGRIYYIHIDGDSAKLRSVADAVRLAANFSPQNDFPIHAHSTIQPKTLMRKARKIGISHVAKLRVALAITHWRSP